MRAPAFGSALALVFLALVFLAAAGARAEDAPATQPVRLHVSATTCADEDSMWRALVRRASGVRPAAAGEKAPEITVEIAREDGRIAGRMRVSSSTDAAAVRTVIAPTCDEVLQTLTLMIALALVPDAGSTPAPSALPATASPPAEPRGTSDRAAATSPPDTAVPVPIPPPRARWRFAAGAQGIASGVGRGALGLGMFVDAEREPEEPRASLAWAASWRLGASASWLETTNGPVTGSVAWRVLELDACPLVASLADRLTLRPGARVEAGTIDASATGVDQARSFTRPWISPGVRARLTWAAYGPLFVAVDAAAAFPLFRDVFEVAPGLRVFRAPAVVAAAAAAFGVRFL